MKKYIGIIIIICIFLFCFFSVVNANSFKLLATPNKTTLKPGDEVEITLKLADIDIGTNGINAVEAKLVYNENIFETVTQNDIKSMNNWGITYNGENTAQKGKILGIILSTGVKNDQEIATIKLKVKSNITSNAKTKETNINITNIITNDGSKLIYEEDKEIPITIEFDGTAKDESYINIDNIIDNVDDNNNNSNNASNSGNNNNNSDNVGVSANNNSNNANNSNININNNKESTTAQRNTAEGNMPQTGTNEIIFIGMALILVVLGTAGYIRYRRIKLI